MPLFLHSVREPEIVTKHSSTDTFYMMIHQSRRRSRVVVSEGRQQNNNNNNSVTTWAATRPGRWLCLWHARICRLHSIVSVFTSAGWACIDSTLKSEWIIKHCFWNNLSSHSVWKKRKCNQFRVRGSSVELDNVITVLTGSSVHEEQPHQSSIGLFCKNCVSASSTGTRISVTKNTHLLGVMHFLHSVTISLSVSETSASVEVRWKMAERCLGVYSEASICNTHS